MYPHIRDLPEYPSLPEFITKPTRKPDYQNLTPLAQTFYQHMRRANSITAREAMGDYGITSGSLSKRICEIEEEGFKVKRERRVHPMTGQKYTRYSIDD